MQGKILLGLAACALILPGCAYLQRFAPPSQVCAGPCTISVSVTEEGSKCVVHDPGNVEMTRGASGNMSWQIPKAYAWPADGIVVHEKIDAPSADAREKGAQVFTVVGRTLDNQVFTVRNANTTKKYYPYTIKVNRANGSGACSVDPGVINGGQAGP